MHQEEVWKGKEKAVEMVLSGPSCACLFTDTTIREMSTMSKDDLLNIAWIIFCIIAATSIVVLSLFA